MDIETAKTCCICRSLKWNGDCDSTRSSIWNGPGRRVQQCGRWCSPSWLCLALSRWCMPGTQILKYEIKFDGSEMNHQVIVNSFTFTIVLNKAVGAFAMMMNSSASCSSDLRSLEPLTSRKDEMELCCSQLLLRNHVKCVDKIVHHWCRTLFNVHTNCSSAQIVPWYFPFAGTCARSWVPVAAAMLHHT
jgi:hypothetical protein